MEIIEPMVKTAETEKHPSGEAAGKRELLKKNQLFQGSVITAGEGLLLVQQVGDETFYGSMAKDLQEDAPESPLKKRLNSLAATISRLGYLAAAAVAFADLFHSFLIANRFDLTLVAADFTHLSVWLPRLLHALTLATAVIVMAVPEGLPMMITVVLSSNMFRMLRDQVMVRKLVGIETSGSMNILFTDKTGTLTQGRLQVTHIIDGSGKDVDACSKCPAALQHQLVLQALYNTGCSIAGKKVLGGNATDRALAEAVLPLKHPPAYPVAERLPFDSTYKYSAARLQGKEELVLIKGAPERLLKECRFYLDPKGEKRPFDGQKLEELRRVLSAGSVRLLAVALAPQMPTSEKPPQDLTFVAMLGIRDTLRREVPAAVREVRNAGVQVVMITGDSKETAVAIARDAGLLEPHGGVVTGAELAAMKDEELLQRLPDLRVVARALPTDKSRLVRLAQQKGLVAGMTGDGINDAPALKRADVGFAMGSGTEVAKEAGDIIILDNNFASIAKAIRYGRTIFKSIRKFIVYQFTMNLSAVGVSLIGPFIGIDTPVTVIQMLWINIIMDSLAGLAFSGEPSLREYMKEPPKKREEPIINRAMAGQILGMGLYTTGICLLLLWLPFFRKSFGFYRNPLNFLTAFYALFIFAGVFNSFNARTDKINPLANLFKNPLFFVIMLLVTAVQLVMIYCGGRVFRTTGLSLAHLQAIGWLAFSVLPAEMLRKRIFRKKR